MSRLVFKILRPSNSFHGVDYNGKKQKNGTAKLIHFQNFGYIEDGRQSISKDAAKKYLQNYSNRNKRIKNKQFHAILSCKGNSFTHDQLKQQAISIMGKLGYTHTPMLIYAHHDTDNNHIHIIASRVGLDGKKINDSYEGKRANEILNSVLEINTKQNFQTHINHVLAYKFSTHAQCMLLMEGQGYQSKNRDDTIQFFKHGKQQGAINKEALNQLISKNSISLKSNSQIRALIEKYRKEYEATLMVSLIKNVYRKNNMYFKSDLTDFLKSRFGLEFIFFASKNHDKPYGYAIIDHKNQAVYKGSDIVKLEELFYQNDTIKQDLKVAKQEETKNNLSSLENDASTENKAINLNLDKMITAIENQVEVDIQKASANSRRNKRNKFI